MNLKATVFIGDAAKMQSFLPENHFDLIISGPPYWNEVVYSQEKGQLSAIDDYDEFLKSISEVWQGCSHTLKEGGILALWVHDFFRKDHDSLVYIPFHDDLIKSMPGNLPLRNVGIWDRYLHKDRGLLDISAKVSTRFQYILVFQKQGLHPRNHDLIENSFRDLYWNPIWNYKTHPRLAGSRMLFRILFELQRIIPFSVFLKKNIKRALVKDDHVFTHYTTECPEEIAVRLIQKFTRPGDNVLDPFLGSGTTMKIAQRLNRNCTGIEINKEALSSIQNKIGFSPEVIRVP
ncbi:MAG: site-specific DNA-methyltransferase [Patescibacteria group bacterium]